jgi:hypothetical protein
MDMKRFAFAAAITMVLASVSQAAIINSALTPGLNSINDRDVARLIDNVGGNGLADVGDVIESVLIFDNISNAAFGGTPLENAVGDPTYQLTAFIETTVLIKLAIVGPDGIEGTADDLGPNGAGPDNIVGTNDDLFFFRLDMDADVYEDNSALANTILVDFASQSAAAAITAATDGNLILTLETSGTGAVTPGGAAGAADTFDIISAADFSLLTTGNEANYILAASVTANPGLIPFLPDFTESGEAGVPPGTGDFHDFVGVGEEEVAAASVAARGWDTQSDTTIHFTAVPEPVSFVVWGALSGLVGIAIYRRRKQD